MSKYIKGITNRWKTPKNPSKTVVEILNVSHHKLDSKRLLGVHIDAPQPGSQTDVYAFSVSGWVLGRECRAVMIELVHGGRVMRRIPVSVPRPDLAIHHPKVPWVKKCGFTTEVGVLGMPPEFELQVWIVLEDENRIPLGVIRGRHRPLHSSFQPMMQPLMITFFARTGSTWLMRLLAEHPQIVAHRTYPYETCTAGYWMHMLKVLSEPANRFESARRENFRDNIWWVGHNPYYTKAMLDGPQAYHWFGSTYVEELAAFCQHSIEASYRQLAGSQGKTTLPCFFAEKLRPGWHIPWLIWEIYPQARQIILVRDLRDAICSARALNAKRGYLEFGRERVGTDEQWIRNLRSDALLLLQAWKHRCGKAYLVRYEDLVLHSVGTLRTLLQDLALDHEPATIKKMIQEASKETPELRQHRTSQDPKSSIGRWRHELEPRLQAVCHEAFGDILREFGYRVEP